MNNNLAIPYSQVSLTDIWWKKIFGNLYLVPFIVTIAYAMNTRVAAIVINQYEKQLFLCGFLFFILRFGYFLSNVGAIFLLDYFGTKKALVAAMSVLVLSTVVIAFYNSVLGLFIFGVLIAGIAGGTSKISSHSLVDELAKHSKGKQFVRLHLYYVMGSLLASCLFGGSLLDQVGWVGICTINVVLISLGLVVTAINIFGARSGGYFLREDNIRERKDMALLLSGVKRSVFDRRSIYFSVVLGLFGAFELGMFSWLIMFFVKETNTTFENASRLLSLLFISLIIGRIIGAPLIEKIGYLKSILIMNICVTIIFLVVLVLGASIKSINYLLPFYGLFSAVLYPLTFTLACEEFKQKSGALISSIFLISSILPPLANIAVGKIGSLFGMRAGIAFLFVLFLMFFILIIIKYFTGYFEKR